MPCARHAVHALDVSGPMFCVRLSMEGLIKLLNKYVKNNNSV